MGSWNPFIYPLLNLATHTEHSQVNAKAGAILPELKTADEQDIRYALNVTTSPHILALF